MFNVHCSIVILGSSLSPAIVPFGAAKFSERLGPVDGFGDNPNRRFRTMGTCHNSTDVVSVNGNRVRTRRIVFVRSVWPRIRRVATNDTRVMVHALPVVEVSWSWRHTCTTDSIF